MYHMHTLDAFKCMHVVHSVGFRITLVLGRHTLLVVICWGPLYLHPSIPILFTWGTNGRSYPMSGRTGGQVQMNRLSLRNSRLKFKTSGNLPIILEESIEYTLNEYSKTGRCQHVSGWIYNKQDFDRLYPKTSRAKSIIQLAMTIWIVDLGDLQYVTCSQITQRSLVFHVAQMTVL